MKWSFATIGMFILGIMGVAAIILFQKLTTSNENDYYLLKEITEAAMYDSIDLSYYKKTGELKIIREKFVENFTRRYSASTLFIGNSYTLKFYDIIETPPKVTIFIDTGFEQYRVYGDDTVADYDVQNALTGIFEYFGEIKQKQVYTTEYYSMVGVGDTPGTFASSQPINIPVELSGSNIENIKLEITGSSVVTDLGEVMKAKLKREIDWPKARDTMPTNFTETIDLSKYANSVSFSKRPTVYDCRKGIGDICDGIYNNYWISWSGTTDSKYSIVALKLQAKWTYDEYVYE